MKIHDEKKTCSNKAEVKILLTGYTNADCRGKGEEETTRCTTTLIRDGKFVIISDPGVLESQQILINALARENLTVTDITHVFITHSHMDHYRNIGMFSDAIAIDYWGLWEGAKNEKLPEKLSDNINFIKTPGHSYDGMTMIAKTNDGKIAVVGDLWWSERGPAQDPYANNLNELKKSREKIPALADFIIPGHGEMFRTGCK